MTAIRSLAYAARGLALLAALQTAPAFAEDPALIQKFGGAAGMVKIVDDATNIWLADPRIKDTFDDINLVRFKKHLSDQLCELVGGPCKYTGRNMYEAHKGLHLNTAEFNALAEDLQVAMDKNHVPFFAQNRLMALLAPMQHDVVTRP